MSMIDTLRKDVVDVEYVFDDRSGNIYLVSTDDGTCYLVKEERLIEYDKYYFNDSNKEGSLMHISRCEDCACRHTCYKYSNIKEGISGWSDYFDEDCDCEHYFRELPRGVGESVFYRSNPNDDKGFEKGTVVGYSITDSGVDMIIQLKDGSISVSCDLVGTQVVF